MTDFATNLINGLTQKEYDLENPNQDKLVNDIENKKISLNDAAKKFQEMAEQYGLVSPNSPDSSENGVDL